MTPQAPLRLPARDLRTLLARLGPSLGLWRAAEVAALREQPCDPPVVDLGCGDGLVTSLVLPRVDLGLDPDEAALARAARTGAYARLRAARIQDAALPPGCAATVLSNSVLEHVDDLDPVLAAVARVLRPGGRLVCTVPTHALAAWLALPSARYAAWRNRSYAHVNLWPPGRWAERLRAAGLHVESVRPYLRRPLVAAWDALDLLQQVRAGRTRPAGALWRRLPPPALDRLAARAARLDLAAPPPGGGMRIVARKH